jgi:16S rRNA (cytosine1402-N4)-methyltransferase
MESDFEHQSVLLDEALEALQIVPDGLYVDGTFGRGGHARAILEKLGPQGSLIAFDKDPEAVRVAQALSNNDSRFSIKQGSFAMLEPTLVSMGLSGKINGILLDLGVSSPQLDDAARGFSFLKEGPLDMRMDPTSGISAAEWLATVSEKELAEVLRDLGEERFHKRIARAIVQKRQESPIETTTQLAEIVKQANPRWEKHKHPATRAFQAIRIYINRELEDVQNVLQQAVNVLAVGGRLVVISFHSLEDRIVKRFIRDQSRGKPLPPDLPVTRDEMDIKMKSMGKAIVAGEKELKANPRSRSAVMRVAERLA